MRVGMEPSERGASSRILIVTVDDLKAGFLVDKLGGVKAVKAASIVAPGPDSGVEPRFLKGVIATPAAGVLLLDAASLIWPDEQL
jgi:chemotaxis signal transduction protein